MDIKDNPFQSDDNRAKMVDALRKIADQIESGEVKVISAGVATDLECDIAYSKHQVGRFTNTITVLLERKGYRLC